MKDCFVVTYDRALREECGYERCYPYWDWSLEASSTNNGSTAIYETAIFDPDSGFGGNGTYVEATAEQNPLNITGHTGGGCVANGPFAYPDFKINIPSTGCLNRDFTPWIMNYFAQHSLVDHVLSQPDYTSFAFAIENVRSFDQPNIHGSGHFGVGGVLGTLGNVYNSPGDPLFYLHHGNLDRILWEWQSKERPVRLNQVGGPIAPLDYGGKNVTLYFEVNIGACALAGNASLHNLLNPVGKKFCYTYE